MLCPPARRAIATTTASALHAVIRTTRERCVALCALAEAATTTRGRLDTIIRRDRTGHPLTMPYVLAVLKEILGEPVDNTTLRDGEATHCPRGRYVAHQASSLHPFLTTQNID